MIVVDAHYFWAEHVENKIEVVFSEQAGVPDPILSHLADRVTEMKLLGKNDYSDTIPLKNHGDHLIGNVCCKDKPFITTGFLDYGPFREMTPPPDLQYTFAVQVYDSESDWTTFFEDLQSISHFTVIMKSCGPPYKLAIVGNNPEIKKVDVCLFQKGGLKIGCTSGEPNYERNAISSILVDISLTREDNDIIPAATGSTLYALANATIGESDSRTIMFASTSINFEGPCTE